MALRQEFGLRIYTSGRGGEFSHCNSILSFCFALEQAPVSFSEELTFVRGIFREACQAEGSGESCIDTFLLKEVG